MAILGGAAAEQMLRIILEAKDQYSKEFGHLESAAKDVGQSIGRVGAQMTSAITVPILGIAAASTAMASNLDASMRNIQSVGKQTDEELQQLSKTFVEMSTNAEVTTDSAAGLAEAFYDIQGSGFEGADAMMVLESATMAATAGLTQTATAAQGITAVLNSYGKGAEEAQIVSDLMFRTVDRGVGSFEELNSSLSGVVGTAAQGNVSFEEISAALATMSKQGISFAEGATSLNQVMLSFIKPSEDMTKAIRELGFASGQAMLDELGLAGSMQALSEAGYQGTEALAALFPNVRALRGALALTGDGAEMFAEDLAQMSDVLGASQEAFEIQSQSFQAQLKTFRNQLAAVGISLGNVIIPVLSDLLKIIGPMVTAFANAPPWVHKLAVAFLALLAAIGPVLMIVGKVITVSAALPGAISAVSVAIPGLVGAISSAWAAIVPLGAAIGAVSLPVLLLVGALVLLGATFIRWGGKASLFERAMESLGLIIHGVHDVVFALGQRIRHEILTANDRRNIEEGGGAFKRLGENINQSLQSIGGNLQGLGQYLVASVQSGDWANDFITHMDESWRGVAGSIGKVIAWPKDMWLDLTNAWNHQYLPGLADQLGQGFAEFVAHLGNRFATEMDGFDPLMAFAILFNEWFNAMIDLGQMLIATGADAAVAMIALSKQILDTAVQAIIGLPALVAGIAANVSEIVVATVTKAIEMLKGLIAVLSDLAVALRQRAIEAFQGFKERMQERLREISQSIKDWIAGLPGMLRAGMQQVKDTLRAVGESILNFFRTLPSTLRDFGNQILQGLIDGMRAKFNELVELARQAAARLKAALRTAFQIRSPSKLTFEIGEQLAQGIVQGFSGTSLASDITGLVSGGMPAVGGAAAGGGFTIGPNYINANSRAEGAEAADGLLDQLNRRLQMRGMRGV
jgi:TP901 family phage tail tape measure protein